MNDRLTGMEVTGERFVPTSSDPRGIATSVGRYLKMLDRVKGKRVLDVGCGIGLGSWLMACVAESVTGADASEDALSYARLFPNPGNLSFVQCDFLKDIPKGSFDVAVAMEFLEHLDDPQSLMARLKRSGIPSLIFSVPLGSLAMSDFHKYRIDGMKDVTDLFDPIVRVDKYEVFDRCWIMGWGDFR